MELEQTELLSHLTLCSAIAVGSTEAQAAEAANARSVPIGGHSTVPCLPVFVLNLRNLGAAVPYFPWISRYTDEPSRLFQHTEKKKSPNLGRIPLRMPPLQAECCIMQDTTALACMCSPLDEVMLRTCMQDLHVSACAPHQPHLCSQLMREPDTAGLARLRPVSEPKSNPRSTLAPNSHQLFLRGPTCLQVCCSAGGA